MTAQATMGFCGLTGVMASKVLIGPGEEVLLSTTRYLRRRPHLDRAFRNPSPIPFPNFL